MPDDTRPDLPAPFDWNGAWAAAHPHTQNPWDHNGECKYCDELAAHSADCRWLARLIVEVGELQTENARLKASAAEVAEIHNPALLAQMDQAVRLQQREFQVLTLCSLAGVEAEEHLESTVKQLFDAGAAARDFAGKIQFLIDWADQNHLLEEHLFTFPDGDVWEAKAGRK